MKKFFLAMMAIATVAMVGCKKNPEPTPTPGPTPGPDTTATDDMPEVEGIAGKVILVVNFEVAPCNDVVFAGNYNFGDGEEARWDGNYAKFEQVEGNWYMVVIDAATDELEPEGKAVQLDGESFNWSYQWAKNSVTVLDGDGYEIIEENGGEQKFKFDASATVVFATSTGWATNPCAEAIPAGTGTFEVKILDREYDAEDVCIFTGNFDEKGWGDSDREMTYDAEKDTWSWTGAYPKNFEYKVVYNGEWAQGDNAVFDGETYYHEFNIDPEEEEGEE